VSDTRIEQALALLGSWHEQQEQLHDRLLDCLLNPVGEQSLPSPTLAERYAHITCSACNGSNWHVLDTHGCLREEFPTRGTNGVPVQRHSFTGDIYTIAVCGCGAKHFATKRKGEDWQGDGSAIALMRSQ
jgi:hypothetical protein